MIGAMHHLFTMSTYSTCKVMHEYIKERFQPVFIQVTARMGGASVLS